ncbi:hypothetical protein [Hafnia psychrotolerans]|uniref:Apea-like HEPN domain-containing protein n=1 Tax=Hafnia psychrotolerans TaxID=1477018 RepID=A0ABQ1H7R9_9GAMM|nr:hypothetical protein [Hafnia psychrotolerans]ELW7373742.1 hypothetical protein [Yersinia enterocolitica]ELY5238376.1 hypothetical protein [Yersinia enterocolitica]GGA62867.1 hypothetical protein GCM10011328_42550 [Hafnia psychrotolerans]
MARVHSIKKSGQHLDISYVIHKKSVLDRSITLMYSTKNPDYYADFVGLSEHEIESEKEVLIKENDTTHSLLLLTAIEALIRLDADKKYCTKKKDDLSKRIKEIYDRTKGEKIKLDEDLINARLNEDSPETRKFYNNLKKCFKYRHWLAHGRYWDSTKVSIVNFDSILIITQSILALTNYDFET